MRAVLPLCHPLARASELLAQRPTFPGRLKQFSVEILLAMTFLLNIFDAFMSLHFFRQGLAVEANPLMRLLLAGGPAVFFFGKCALVACGLLILLQHRTRALARVGSVLVAGVYSLLAGWHCYGLTLS